MPIYEFYCENCKTVIEEILQIGSDNLKCKKCGNELKKKMSSFSGIIKGSTNRSLDSVIGESAEKRWKTINQRKLDRDKIRKSLKEKTNVN